MRNTGEKRFLWFLLLEDMDGTRSAHQTETASSD